MKSMREGHSSSGRSRKKPVNRIHSMRCILKHVATKLNVERPERLDLLLDRPPVTNDVRRTHGWNPDDCSAYVDVCEDGASFERRPMAQSTDCVRGRVGYTRGVHVWELNWPKNQRGTHAVVGVATKDAPLHCVGYASLVGADAHSWGWDLGRNSLQHDSTAAAAANNNNNNNNNNAPESGSSLAYPRMPRTNEKCMVPERFRMVLDMEAGTLGFMVGRLYLGHAFTGLWGKELYPIASAVWGYCHITMQYIGGIDASSMSLRDLARFSIRQMMRAHLGRVNELPVPTPVQRYLLHQPMWE